MNLSVSTNKSVDLALSERERIHLAPAPANTSPIRRGHERGKRVAPTDSPGATPASPSSDDDDLDLGMHVAELRPPARFVVLPHDPSRRVVTWLTRLAVLVELIILPYCIAFGYLGCFCVPLYVMLLLDAVHVLETLTAFCTGYYRRDGMLVKSHAAIARNYALTCAAAATTTAAARALTRITK